MIGFTEKVRTRMARTGETYWQACRVFGSAGGRRAAANKRRERQGKEKFHEEQLRQVARGLRDADEVPDAVSDDVMTAQDRTSIALDQRKRRLA